MEKPEIKLISRWRKIYRYSGLKFIYRKFIPVEKSKLPTGPLWIIGIYVAFFGVASQRYENRIDIIENRANAVFTQLSTSIKKKALGRISTIQNMGCPYKPNILNPFSVFGSLFFPGGKYEEMVVLLKETVEDWKNSLDSVNLDGANLEGAYLEKARNLTIEQLSKVKTLYEVKNLIPKLMDQIKEKYPHLLEKPKDEKPKDE